MKEYYVARWCNSQETRQVLEWFDTEEEADAQYDRWTAVFPNAWLDVYSITQDGEPEEDYTTS